MASILKLFFALVLDHKRTTLFSQETMEPLGAFPDFERGCFHGVFTTEEYDYLPQFLGQSSLVLGEHDEMIIGIESTESMFNSLDAFNSNLQSVYQESSFSSNCSGDAFFIANPGHTSYFFSNPDQAVVVNDACMSMNVVGMVDENNTGSFIPSFRDVLMEETVATQMHLNRKFDVPELEASAEVKTNRNSTENQKKPRASKDGQNNKRTARPKKNQKVAGNKCEAEETNAGLDGQSSSSYSLEEDNASQENSGGATSESKSLVVHNSNGKTRASRGSATDPQSLYARKRRERINERLRILQNLVPNGTKVDISTMLEEAVHYVKFLQLQIKLLSSDELWMYTPIAYNGVDIGLNISRNISPLL